MCARARYRPGSRGPPTMPSDQQPSGQADAFALTPMQQGMLFNGLFAPRAGVNLEQLLCELPEAIDRALLEQAWALVIRRHAMLRTSFRWEGLEQPLQAPAAEVAARVTEIDLRGRDPSTQEQAIVRFRRDDRRSGFAF